MGYKMAEEKKSYDDPSNWEYDCGSPNWTGDPDNLSPAMKEISDNLTKQAFPEGREAYQKQQQAARK